MKTNKLLRKLAVNFPKSIKSPGDYVGLMTGKLKDETNTILLCLDFDNEVYETMIEKGYKPDLILTHHPFIYGTKYRVFKHDLNKKELCEKIDSLNIPVYSMHTNFDTGKYGMNDALANALHLKNVKPLETCPMARGGELENEMDVIEFAKTRQVLVVPCCNFWDKTKKLGTKEMIVEISKWLDENKIKYEIITFKFKGPKNIGILTY